MAWHVALVLDTEYPPQEISALVHQMPVWAIKTDERQLSASMIRTTAGDMWAPDPAFTLFTPHGSDQAEICRNILGTVLEHHPQLACLDLIGVPDSLRLSEILNNEKFIPVSNSPQEKLSFRKPIETLANVRELFLDASRWRTNDDLYEAFFEVVGAAAFHGKNFNALEDSIVTGGINKIEVPYRIVLENFVQIRRSMRPFIEEFIKLIQKFESQGCPIAIQTIPGPSGKILRL